MVKVRNQKTRKHSRRNYEEEEIQVFDLQNMIEGFLLEQNCKGNSQATVKYYEGNIIRFDSYLEEQGLDTNTSSITKQQIQKYILYLKSSKKWAKTDHIESSEQLTSKSIQTYIRALKAWVAWMEEEGYLEEGISSEIKLPKAARKVIEILTEEEIQEIFKYLESKTEKEYWGYCDS
jgi:integrase/recombinase XerC/integrase/recombinase XerD